MSPGERKRKAKQLAGLIEQLDVAHLVHNQLALDCLDLLKIGDKQGATEAGAVACAIDQAFRLINTIAMEGPLKYAGRGNKLREPAE